MDKIKFIAASLHTGLKIQFNNNIPVYVDLFGVVENDIICKFRDGSKGGFIPEESKPILHRLSYLTREIEHNGEKFIPIVELAKIAGLFGSKSKLNNFLVERWRLGFRYLNEDEYFYLNEHDLELSYIKNKTEFPIKHQFKLFQKLIEWHFDIAGLIEKGEAIDVNTLSENPYK